MVETVNKFLEEVIAVVVGKQGEGLVDLLDGNKYVNEFLIAKKLDITINQARNILYKISDFGLVSSIRKKDKKKGWYTYFWKIEILKCLEFLRAEVLKRSEQVKNQIKSRESKVFYVCNRCNIELNEENAMMHDFTCVECGQVFEIKDNEKLLKELSRNFQRFEEKLKEIDEEILKERDKVEKVKQKDIQKEQKEKKEKRDEARRNRPKKEGSKIKVVKKEVKKKEKPITKKTAKKPLKESLKKPLKSKNLKKSSKKK
jgi:transcription factor E